MVESSQNYLIVGLGNIGNEYKGTRHNIGFIILDALAKRYNSSFQNKPKLKGEISQIFIEEKKILLLKPSTYMNLSGEAVRETKDFYKIDLEKILVIVDDIAIPFKEMRLKEKSGTGGHKGLLSIEKHLATQDYSRLRIGVANENYEDLASFVLDNFTEEEQKSLPDIINKAIDILLVWLMQGVVVAMNQANVRKKEKKVKDER